MFRVHAVAPLIEAPRKSKRMSQLELAGQLGLTQTYMSLVCRGYISNIRTVRDVARILDADWPAILSALRDALPAIRAANQHRLAEDVEAALADHQAAA